MSLPALLRFPPIRERGPLRSPAHLDWVRSHACSVANCFEREIEAAHVRIGTDGGMGMKPGDNWTVSLCWRHHQRLHRYGERTFERLTGLQLKPLAEAFADKSPVLRRRRSRR